MTGNNTWIAFVSIVRVKRAEREWKEIRMREEWESQTEKDLVDERKDEMLGGLGYLGW